ncbi:hypothetical protein BGW38_004204, partial [Lunasporangiospora selenospora]
MTENNFSPSCTIRVGVDGEVLYFSGISGLQRTGDKGRSGQEQLIMPHPDQPDHQPIVTLKNGLLSEKSPFYRWILSAYGDRSQIEAKDIAVSWDVNSGKETTVLWELGETFPLKVRDYKANAESDEVIVEE